MSGSRTQTWMLFAGFAVAPDTSTAAIPPTSARTGAALTTSFFTLGASFEPLDIENSTAALQGLRRAPILLP